MTRKYEVLPGPEHQKEIELDGKKIIVHRIKALTELSGYDEDMHVSAGELGGWVESTANLSPFGASCIAGDAIVCQSAIVKSNAWVTGCAIVSGNAIIGDGAIVSGNARVSGMAELYETTRVDGNALVTGDTVLFGCPIVVTDNAVIEGKKETGKKGYTKRMLLKGEIYVYGNAVLRGACSLVGSVSVSGDSVVEKCYLDGSIDIVNSTVMKNALNGRFSIINDEKVTYFEKTRVPRKFYFKKADETLESN